MLAKSERMMVLATPTSFAYSASTSTSCAISMLRACNSRVALSSSASSASRSRRRAFGALTLDREGQLSRDSEAHGHVIFRETVGLAKVRHEFADQRAVGNQRNERGGADALAQRQSP